MPTIQNFDQLNDVNNMTVTKEIQRSMPYEKYFGEMVLTRQQKEDRIALAKDLEDVMMFFFSMVLLMNDYAYMTAISTVNAKDQLKERLTETVGRHTVLTEEIEQEIDEFAEDVNNTTTEHLIVMGALADEPDTPERQEKEKREREFTSEDRAKLLAEEEANTILNFADFDKAKRLGFKYKRWNTMKDSRVRKDHRAVEGKTIPIDDYFLVGNSLLRFPRDTKLGASRKQIIGCRCSVTYLKKY